MSDETVTDSNANKIPDKVVDTPPPVIAPPPTNSPDMAAFFKNVADSIAAIPEKIVDAIREATPAPKTEAVPVNTEQTTSTEIPAPGDKPKGKTFANRWFGV